MSLEKGKPIQIESPHTQIQVCELNGTIYSDTLSQLGNVTELRICRSNIEKIEPGALCSSQLKTLELDFYTQSQPPTLSKEVFDNCDIEELILRFGEDSTIYKIDDDALGNLTNLKKLYLQGYNLEHVEKNFLKLPHNELTVLEFSLCNIHQIDSDVFEDLKDLESIAIVHNRELKSLPKDLFKNNSKLKTLTLRSNAIENVTWDEFEGLANLETLTMSENRINQFDADKIATNLPNLKYLNIDLNPPPCKQKEAFVNELKTKLTNVDVTYKFDPGYYDSCEDEI